MRAPALVASVVVQPPFSQCTPAIGHGSNSAWSALQLGVVWRGPPPPPSLLPTNNCQVALNHAGNWADCPTRLGMQQGTAALLTLVRYEGGAVEVGEQAWHGQAGGTQRASIRVELTVAAAFADVEWDGGKTTSLVE